ncbi:glycosyltransferase family 2 protein [Chitiniphilus eburneus]|uniref:Glycosyltransferase family 2 protein n=1 Tax=Chitiniphilus eburneus TaxID=2571148 RepID=A0A4U0Q814_9NEIS|nr:glycosyltransferase family 2 protein [Chitiniphilus eburneus]TJZ77369.1 glycosyltransferase family 2 protein [Chitiniphilus eburneus]
MENACLPIGPAASPLLSVVVPAYNEEAVLATFHARLAAVFDTLSDYRCEVIYVNDGSRDGTQRIIDDLCARDGRAASVDLSRNFGKEIAMTAGLDHATGDWIVMIDADLQDPPELIPDMLAKAAEGFDTVFARRTHRDGESALKKATAAAFYRVMDQLSGKVKIPRDTGDFRLMSRRAVDALLKLREQHRFMKGLFAWVGFPSVALDYRRDPRAAGDTKFNYWKLWNFALEGITSFTIGPLKIATYMGLLTAAFAFLDGLWIIGKTLFMGEAVRGYPTLMVTMLFLGGVQLFFIGVIGEYLGRIFDETKGRPLYFAQGWKPARNHGHRSSEAGSLSRREMEDDQPRHLVEDPT